MKELDELVIILYTHNSYQDVFDICIKLHEKYSNSINVIIFSNTIMNNDYPNILYDEHMTYPERISYCLEKIPDKYKYIILSHDWVLMYDYINLNKIIKLMCFMKNNNIDQIRLLNSSCGSTSLEIHNNVYHIDNHGLLFSVQPTIWKTDTIKKITSENKNFVYRNIEWGIQEYMKQFNNCFYYEGEERFRNAGHHKSNIYPHIHALSHGRWIINENESYIQNIVKNFNIDINIRGTIN
jgi:hypothetical protein